MRPSLTTFLFGDYSIATAVSGQSRYGHTFGGPHDRKGASREDCHGILIHLLHRLDLSDPAIPFAIPGVRWLPFYYCFDFRANEFSYRLISDESLVPFFPDDDPNVSDHEEWPDDEYPLEFPVSSLQIAAHPYDPTVLEDAYNWAGIFGIGRLSEGDQAAVKKLVAEEMEELGLGIPETDEEFHEALTGPYKQGRPDKGCLNPSCSNHVRKEPLTTIALVPAEPIKGIHTFGRWGTGVQLIFQMCERCYTIRVSNQCD